MAAGFVVRKNQYYDSVFLMRIARMLDEEPGVQRTAAVMATDANKKLLGEIGIQDRAVENANANDLVVAVIAQDKGVVDRLLGGIDERLQSVTAVSKPVSVRSIEEAALINPDTNLVIISVPGEYAAREARKALELGKHVFLFSNNVPLEQEVELKKSAQSRRLLVMGPDCGTSIINGVGIGFANVVRRGPIGIIGASGTGIQEFTSLIHQSGSGISHAIGTGSRDLSDAVGGITTLMAVDALEADPSTQVIAIVSKSAQPDTLLRFVNRIRFCAKPVICCLLGYDQSIIDAGDHFTQTATIDEAVRVSLHHLGMYPSSPRLSESEIERLIAEETCQWKSSQIYLRGLFAGGSFCYQSQKILNKSGITVHSNNPADPHLRLVNPEFSRGHTCIDMGDDYYTRGKPHPMIDAGERRRRLLAEAADETVAVLLLDFILGYISSLDPVGDMIDAIRNAQEIAAGRGAHLTFVASICGTDLDHQGLSQQKNVLEGSGVIVFPSNAQAAQFCSRLIQGIGGRDYGA